MFEKSIEYFYPGWRKKALTFTIDDGNTTLDTKFLSMVNPAGFHGTFNLVTPLNKALSEQNYRDLYSGHAISNHCRYHAYPFTDGKQYHITEQTFDAQTADKSLVYQTEEEGLYRIYTYAWTYLATDDKYMACVDSCQKELEALFGKGQVQGYVWPCGEQKNAKVLQRLTDYGFSSLRKTGCVGHSDNFTIPADRMHWSYTANDSNMLEFGEEFDRLDGNGPLRFFCFGVHSHDFENHNTWDVLSEFCRRYGNRQCDFWYAPVADIFAYEDATKQIRWDGNEFVNSSGTPVFASVDGLRIEL